MYYAVAFRFSDSPAVCWAVHVPHGVMFAPVSRAERAVFSSFYSARQAGAQFARDLGANFPVSFRWAIVRIK